MRRNRIISFALAIALTISTLAIVAKAKAMQSENPFSAKDRERNNIIAYATGEKKGGAIRNTYELGDSERYIVTFKKNVPLNRISNALKGYNYRLLAQSEQRVFLVYTDEEFEKKHSDIIESFEKDSAKEIFEVIPNDTYAQSYELEMINMYEAWEYGTGSKDIIIAVTDSGIYREHEDLEGANILEGYDFATGSTGVDTDSSGHGTKVAGLLAATPDNEKGSCGIASGCSILPLKITSENGKIYTSDFLDAIYMAADGGANIINMSLGGYEFIESEDRAMKYAYEKGCILVAASGNEGNDADYAGMKCYPASYDGVISVGSVDSEKKSCVFSQHNDAVDISAPGKDLTVLSLDNGYTTSSGTSFSAAFVSGTAALALSKVGDDIKMNSDAFDFLLTSCAFGESNNRLGAGIIDVSKTLANTNKPLVWGVENKGVYYDNVSIYFNRGVATLDGEAFKSGDLCKHTGNHTLIVSDNGIETKVEFTTDNLPLKCELKDAAGYSYIVFSYGEATLNGLPYKSGEKITTEGSHTLVLTSPYGNSESFTFDLSFAEAAIFGVENGKTYNSPVAVSVPSGGTITLDGNTMENRCFTVYENGEHTITVNKNGNRKDTVSFRIDYQQNEIQSSVANARSSIGFGVIVVWNEISRGIRLYDSETLQLHKYINLGENVINIHFSSEKLYVSGTNTLFAFDGATLKKDSTSEKIHKFSFPVSASVFCDNSLYFAANSAINSGTIVKLPLDTLEEQEICTTKFTPDIISYDNSTGFVAYGKKDEPKIFLSSIEGEAMKTVHISKEPQNGFIFCNGKIAYGGNIYSISKKMDIFHVEDEKALYFDGTTLITENAIYNSDTLENLGTFAMKLEYLSLCENLYCASFDGSMLYISETLPAASIFKTIGNGSIGSSSELHFPLSTEVTNCTSIKNKIYYTDNSNVLYSADKGSLSIMSHFFLPFVPTGIKALNEYLYIYSNKISYIIIYNTETGQADFFETPAPVTKLDTGKDIFAFISNEILYIYNTDLKEIRSDDSNTYFSVCVSKDGKSVYSLFERSFYTILKCSRVSDGAVSYEKLLNYDAYDIFCDDEYLYINTAVYNADDGTDKAFMTSRVYGKVNNTFLTATGLYENGKYISNISIGAKVEFLDSNGDIYLFSSNSLNIIKNIYGTYNTPSDVSGVEDGGVYSSSVTFNFTKGKAYLDGAIINDGKTVSTGGNHTLIIAYPYGLLYKYNFTINASLTEIRIKGGDVALKVNGTVKLSVEFYPTGAPATDIMFYCESDVASVSNDGILKGLKPGEATVFAATLDGSLVTSVKVVVRSSVLEFTASYYGTNLTDGILYGVPSGTTVSTFFNFMTKESRANSRLFDINEEEVTDGIIKTGMEIRLFNSKGEIVDSLLISVTGDCNGDGDVDIGDLVCASNMLGNKDYEPVFITSADFSNNGIIDVADTFTYKEIILGNETSVSVANISKPISNSNLILKCSESNGIYSLTIHSEEALLGISGEIIYSEKNLEFISSEKIGVINGTQGTEGRLRFVAAFTKGTTDKILKLDFKAKTEGTQCFSVENIMIYTTETKSGENISLSYTPGVETDEDKNATITPSVGVFIPEFSPEIFSYALKVPYGTENVDFSATFPEIIAVGNHNLKDGSIITISANGKEYKITIIWESDKKTNNNFILIVVLTALISLSVAAITVFILMKRKKGAFTANAASEVNSPYSVVPESTSPESAVTPNATPKSHAEAKPKKSKEKNEKK